MKRFSINTKKEKIFKKIHKKPIYIFYKVVYYISISCELKKGRSLSPCDLKRGYKMIEGKTSITKTPYKLYKNGSRGYIVELYMPHFPIPYIFYGSLERCKRFISER